MQTFGINAEAAGIVPTSQFHKCIWRGTTPIYRGQVALLPANCLHGTYNSTDPNAASDAYWGKNAVEVTADTNAYVDGSVLVIATGLIQPGTMGEWCSEGAIDVQVGLGQNAGSDLGSTAKGWLLTLFKDMSAGAPQTYVDRTLFARPAVGTGSSDTLAAPAAFYGMAQAVPVASASVGPTNLVRCLFNGWGAIQSRIGGGA